METKYYIGNHTLRFGLPYVIISARDNGTDIQTETTIFFRAFNGKHKFLSYRSKWGKNLGINTNDILISEKEYSCERIYHEIIIPEYEQQLIQSGNWVEVVLNETTHSILIPIRDYFAETLNKIESLTFNDLLKAQIAIYKSIVVTRNDFI